MGRSLDDGENIRLQKRSKSHSGKCTDCLCLLIFIIFLVGLGFLTALTVLDNGFNRLKNGYDSYGNLCDDQNNDIHLNQSSTHRHDNTGLKYVFYLNNLDPFNGRKLCVSKCPDTNIANINQFVNYTNTHQIRLCGYDTPPGIYESFNCPKLPIFKTYQIVNRCIPDIKELVFSGIVNSTYGDFLEHTINQQTEYFEISIIQLYNNIIKISYLALAALLITITLVFLLRYITTIILYLIMVVSSLGCLAGSGYLWYRVYEIFNTDLNIMTTFPILGIEMKLSTSFIIYASLATFFTIVLILTILSMRSRIGLVIKLIAEAQKTLADMPMIFLLPLFAFAIQIMFLIYWCLTAMMIYSFGKYTDDNLNVLNVVVKKDLLAKIMWVYHFVALIWVSEFIFAFQSMVISGAVAKWYFTRDKNSVSMPIGSSLKKTLTFHMGSIAFGSFIITLIRFPRYVLTAIQTKIKNSPEGSFLAEILKVFTCCLWFLENVMQYINTNAYTIIVIEGVSFCVSTKKSFKLIMNNILRIAIINTVGDFLLLLCKLAVVALTVFLAFLWLQVSTNDIESLKESALPLLVVALIAYLIAHSFFTVYEMVIDALLICFCEDIEANDGTPDRPYFMNKSLKAFVEDNEKTNINIGDNE